MRNLGVFAIITKRENLEISTILHETRKELASKRKKKTFATIRHCQACRFCSTSSSKKTSRRIDERHCETIAFIRVNNAWSRMTSDTNLMLWKEDNAENRILEAHIKRYHFGHPIWFFADMTNTHLGLCWEPTRISMTLRIHYELLLETFWRTDWSKHATFSEVGFTEWKFTVHMQQIGQSWHTVRKIRFRPVYI